MAATRASFRESGIPGLLVRTAGPAFEGNNSVAKSANLQSRSGAALQIAARTHHSAAAIPATDAMTARARLAHAAVERPTYPGLPQQQSAIGPRIELELNEPSSRRRRLCDSAPPRRNCERAARVIRQLANILARLGSAIEFNGDHGRQRRRLGSDDALRAARRPHARRPPRSAWKS